MTEHTVRLSLGGRGSLADRLEFDDATGYLVLNTYESIAQFTREEAREFAVLLVAYANGGEKK